MSKYHIGWLPGDGVGNDVMDAAKIVLDSINFNAEYIYIIINLNFKTKTLFLELLFVFFLVLSKQYRLEF